MTQRVTKEVQRLNPGVELMTRKVTIDFGPQHYALVSSRTHSDGIRRITVGIFARADRALLRPLACVHQTTSPRTEAAQATQDTLRAMGPRRTTLVRHASHAICRAIKEVSGS